MSVSSFVLNSAFGQFVPPVALNGFYGVEEMNFTGPEIKSKVSNLINYNSKNILTVANNEGILLYALNDTIKNNQDVPIYIYKNKNLEIPTTWNSQYAYLISPYSKDNVYIFRKLVYKNDGESKLFCKLEVITIDLSSTDFLHAEKDVGYLDFNIQYNGINAWIPTYSNSEVKIIANSTDSFFVFSISSNGIELERRLKFSFGNIIDATISTDGSSLIVSHLDGSSSYQYVNLSCFYFDTISGDIVYQKQLYRARVLSENIFVEPNGNNNINQGTGIGKSVYSNLIVSDCNKFLYAFSDWNFKTFKRESSCIQINLIDGSYFIFDCPPVIASYQINNGSIMLMGYRSISQIVNPSQLFPDLIIRKNEVVVSAKTIQYTPITKLLTKALMFNITWTFDCGSVVLFKKEKVSTLFDSIIVVENGVRKKFESNYLDIRSKVKAILNIEFLGYIGGQMMKRTFYSISIPLKFQSIEPHFIGFAESECQWVNVKFLDKTDYLDSTIYDVRWDFGDGLYTEYSSNDSNKMVNHIYSEAGNYLVGLKISNSLCSYRSEANYELSILPSARAQIFNSEHKGCSPLSVSFTYSLPDKYSQIEYDFGDGNIASYSFGESSSIEKVFVCENDTEQNFVVTQSVYSESGCVAVDTVSITVLPPPSVMSPLPKSITALGENIEIYLQPISNISFVKLFTNGVQSVMPSSGVIDNISDKLRINNYQFAAVDLCNNVSSKSQIYNNIILNAEIADDNSEIELQWNKPSMDEYVYSVYKLNDNGEYKSVRDQIASTNFTFKNIDFNNHSHQYFYVTAQAVNHSVISNLAKVELNPKLFVPNAFSPNSDGINDSFSLFNIGYLEFEFEVYNRWGQLIYYSRGEAWDGSINGIPSPSGSYMVFVVAIKNNGEKEYISQCLNLIR